ncbi:MAG TPA: MarR family transcriptional regulator [Chloroflexia bacterium]|nr:MarR family transcriptional regulator [Chloroflexia bacterium]
MTTAISDNDVVLAEPTKEQAATRMLEVLPRLFRQMKNEAREQMPQAICDMGDTQFMIVHALSHKAFTMSDLAERLLVSTPTVSRMVDTLVTRGYVARRPDAMDRRKVWLELTDSGRELTGEMEARFRYTMARFLEPLDGPQRDLIVAACNTIASLLPGEWPTDNRKQQPQEDPQ